MFALERALVDVVNKVGVDINRAANELYYSHLLPYVAGLGPRKAQALVKKIATLVRFSFISSARKITHCKFSGW